MIHEMEEELRYQAVQQHIQGTEMVQLQKYVLLIVPHVIQHKVIFVKLYNMVLEAVVVRWFNLCLWSIRGSKKEW